MKVLRLHFMYFFLSVQIKSKTATCFSDILTIATFWLACFLNRFEYMREQAVDRILACVAKWKSYVRIKIHFLLARFYSKTVTCFLWYFDSYAILACVSSNSFGCIQDRAETVFSLVWQYDSLTFAFLMLFYVSANEIKDIYMIFMVFRLPQHSGLRVFSTV